MNRGFYSLYIGDLHPNVSENELGLHFSKHNIQILNSKVCRNHLTGQSNGYGYVNFTSQEMALQALDKVNYTKILGRECRLMWSNKDRSSRQSVVGNIFISNLDEGIDSRILYQTFKQFGEIHSCKVSTNNEGVSNGYGYVHFAEEKDALKAIQTVNGRIIKGRTVTVAKFVNRKKGSKEDNYTNLYIKNFPKTFKEEDLVELFSTYGKILSQRIMIDFNTKESKGFGFLNFEEHESAVKACDELHKKKEIEGNLLYVKRALSRVERAKKLKERYEKRYREKYFKKNLYVKPLESNVNDEKLKQIFQEFGEISSARVMIDPRTGLSRGFGFVCFNTREEALKALETMNQRKDQRTSTYYVAYAERKEDRQRNQILKFQRYNFSRIPTQMLYGGMSNRHQGNFGEVPPQWMIQKYQMNRGGGEFSRLKQPPFPNQNRMPFRSGYPITNKSGQFGRMHPSMPNTPFNMEGGELRSRPRVWGQMQPRGIHTGPRYGRMPQQMYQMSGKPNERGIMSHNAYMMRANIQNQDKMKRQGNRNVNTTSQPQSQSQQPSNVNQQNSTQKNSTTGTLNNNEKLISNDEIQKK
ncbi:polyadenylate-binding protein [Anaeramoeba flamelloides]|uniref:Polyadenylate-binding protein n=1 Tax=Anaeramoeba flamelloides TaxID=1746091 RepID=A0ABQ8YAX3_9EUKA|nr:polyadenylate-binding protein [Anaeramoeba flamelloides]